ncbi:penicillin-binding protein 2 [Novosphingobium sp. FSY-8]|uniref:Penicillin-binding protein 2 n=1 Tax=Novosphingobium ovatum TaxID=1908523 RepID=A0ABW9XCQ3_9SPHN|nr:penicillin-binding protein 2 [Novosphingobium ovatum]NBC36319.1 penicillin-binding protein 2 [Novosphingobium ovatum]
MAKTTTPGTLRNSFDRRSILVGSIQGGIGVLLAARMTYIAVAENQHYVTMAESNRVNLSLIPPRRGWILDRNGQPLASNRADFRVDIIPDKLTDKDTAVATLADVLGLSDIDRQDLNDRLEKASGFQPVEVAAHLEWEKFAALSVRMPDMPGVVPQRSFSRFYPTGPCVGHLIGYVGAANAKDYENEKNPLLVTPGFKIGKDGLEKKFDLQLRGVPGARRAEVTASGKFVRDLDTREDVPGAPIKLTIDAALQEYVARRIGTESGACVVMDVQSGDILAFASMPSFDPNSFTDGVGRVEWKMLAEDDHLPLRNKIIHGLYPPGSTVKPAVALAFLEAGLDPHASVYCGGGLQVGNRVFHCWERRGHGQTDMAKGIYQSCDVYFYHFAQKIGTEKIAQLMKRMGWGQKFDLPFASQSYGTVPDPAWKQRKYKKDWAVYDTVNATIGQGYMLVNPLQQAVVASRIASGNNVQPRLILDGHKPQAQTLGISKEHLDIVRSAMNEVVNGRGTAGRAKLPLDGIQMAGKTGTAQVVGLNIGNGKGGMWKHRDHGHFIAFAPFDNPRYACAVLIEHGGGSSAAYPIARDVMTFLFDPQKAWDALLPMENGWGGTPQQRMAAKYRSYAEKYGVSAPKAEDAEAALGRQEEEQGNPQPIQSGAASPAPEPVAEAPAPAAAAPPPAPSAPSAPPAPHGAPE